MVLDEGLVKTAQGLLPSQPHYIVVCKVSHHDLVSDYSGAVHFRDNSADTADSSTKFSNQVQHSDSP